MVDGTIESLFRARAAERTGADSLLCHPERSGEGTAKAAQSIRLILSFRPRRAASPPSGEILRASVSVTNAFPFLPSPILRGKGDRLRWMRVVPSSLLAAPPKIRSVSPHQALCASSPPWGGKPCVEPCSERLFRSRQDPSTRFARSG